MESRVRVHCECGKSGLVDRKHIGKTITCPKCGIARIKIVDPEANLPKDDESGTINIIDEPTTNKKTEIPHVPVIAQGRLSAIGRHWRLTAILCLVAIIAGMMVYNQYDGWRREKNARESKKWKGNFDLKVEIMLKRQYNDESFNRACGGLPVVDVSADEFLAFVAEQPDDSLFADSFETRVLDPIFDRDEDFSSYDVENMLDRGDLFLRWAILKGGATERLRTCKNWQHQADDFGKGQCWTD
jgi:hypothetical protein